MENLEINQIKKELINICEITNVSNLKDTADYAIAIYYPKNSIVKKSYTISKWPKRKNKYQVCRDNKITKSFFILNEAIKKIKIDIGVI